MAVIAIAVLAVALNWPAQVTAAEPGESPAAAPAATDAFLKIDGIEGESADARHPREIEILSWSSGLSGAGGKPAFTDVAFTAAVSKASPVLMLSCAQGKHLKSAVLTVRAADQSQHEFLKITLNDVVVSSVQSAGSDGQPTDQFALKFGQIITEYTPQNPDGSAGTPVRAGWDVIKNLPI